MAYIDKIQVGGTTYDIQDSNLKRALKQLNSYDYLRDFCKYDDDTKYAVKFVWDSSKTTCTANGTANSNTQYVVMYIGTTAFPTQLTKGETYFVHVKSSNSSLFLRIFLYFSNGTNTSLDYYHDGTITFPNNVVGLVVRLQLANGATAVNDTITVSLTSAKTNEQLGNELSEISDSVAESAFWQGAITAGTYPSCDDIWRSGAYFKPSGDTIENYPYPSGYLLVSSASNNQSSAGILQIAVAYNTTMPPMIRRKNDGEWSDWQFLDDYSRTQIGFILSDIFKYNSYDMIPFGNGVSGTISGISYTKNADGTWTIDGTIESGFSFRNLLEYPNGLPEFIVPGRTYTVHYDGPSTIKLQAYFYTAGGSTGVNVSDGDEIVIPADLTGLIVRFRVNGPATISSETVTVGIVAKIRQTVVNQEIHNDTFNNTYNITTSPQISTDSNGWLQPVDTESQDETGKTDMAGPIMAMLTGTGYCHLAPGIFYVSGNIDMPEGSMLEGCGRKTIIRLLGSVAEGYTVKLEQYNSICNLRISGASTDIPYTTFDENRGTRHGMIFNSRYAEGTQQTEHCTIRNVFIDNFTGCGIKCYNTSLNTARGVYASQMKIQRCQTGIFVDFHSEFNKFELVNTRHCYIGCENDGGNNMFIGCTFGALHTGFIIDNSLHDKDNNAHGSVIGCTFCHIGDNAGIAIAVKNTANGFTFSDCQVWYCSILVEDSYGISFSNMEFGRGVPIDGGSTKGATIRINRGGTVMFTGCVFLNDITYPPTITVTGNSKVKFTGCYGSHSGNAITAS